MEWREEVSYLFGLSLPYKVANKKGQDLSVSGLEDSSSEDEYVEVLNDSARYSIRRDQEASASQNNTHLFVEQVKDELLPNLESNSNSSSRRGSVIVETPRITSTPNFSPTEENFPGPLGQDFPSIFLGPLGQNIPPPPVHITVAMEVAEANLSRKVKRINYKIRKLSIDDLTTEDILTYRADLDSIDNLMEEIIIDLDDLLSTFDDQLSETKKTTYKTMKEELLENVRIHSKNVKTKVGMLRNSTGMEQLPGSLNRLQIDKDKDAREKAVIKAQVLKNNIESKVERLKDQATEVEDWSTEIDASISIAMQSSISSWKKDLDSIVAASNELETLAKINKMTEEEVAFEASKVAVESLVKTVDEKIKLIKAQDRERNLYSMCKEKTSSIKFPGFSGKSHEDFSKFKTEMNEAFKSHRVSKNEQVKKLRECLKGDALKFVPDSKETTLETAWGPNKSHKT